MGAKDGATEPTQAAPAAGGTGERKRRLHEFCQSPETPPPYTDRSAKNVQVRSFPGAGSGRQEAGARRGEAPCVHLNTQKRNSQVRRLSPEPGSPGPCRPPVEARRILIPPRFPRPPLPAREPSGFEGAGGSPPC